MQKIVSRTHMHEEGPPTNESATEPQQMIFCTKVLEA